MSLELTLLIWSVALPGFYIGAQAMLYRAQHGVSFPATGRDNEPAPNVWNQRAQKALRNLLETYGVFVALAAATEIAGRSDLLTQWGALLYVFGRAAYLPLYLFAVPYLRSLVWGVAALGLVSMFVGVAF